MRTWQIWLCIVDCLCDPPSSVACGATFPLKGEGFLTLCEHGGRGKHGRYGKYHFVLWFAFAIRPHPSLTRQTARSFLPPKGKPLHPLHFSQQDGRVKIRKLGCFCNSACFLIFCLLPEIVFTMFAQRKEGFPLGGSCRVSD